MRILWAAAFVVWVFLASEAHADTVYLKDGQSIWGSEVIEEGDAVVVVRPGGTLRFPTSDVSKIERARISIPRFYTAPPGAEATPSAGGTGSSPERPAQAPVAAPKQESQTPAAQGQAAGTPPVSAPAPPVGQPAPTLLPPPPPRGPYAPR